MSRRNHKKRVLNNPMRDANTTLPETLTGEIIGRINRAAERYPSTKMDYLKEVYLSKFVSSETDPADVRARRAINKWLAVERDNEATNTRLLLLPEEYNILPRVTWLSFVTHARGLISHLLGETVPLEAILGSFSGGATTTRSRTSSHPAMKYLGKAELTPAARKWFDLVLEESPLWQQFSDLLVINETLGNHMFTVPKSTTIDRVACKEPDLNMYLQKGVGNYIRRRLRSAGINLNDQSINQRLAREGSVTGRLATIDLSSASDSVSMAIVETLLPDLWYGLLADLRSPMTLVDGEWHENHMFSSMGNGFTFELESLIFWALAKTVRHFTRGSGVISVYGDDIIVGVDYVEDLIWVLNFVGFTVNSEKSFTSGPFRESCGGHYHDGCDISPFFLRKPVTRLRDAIILANQIRKWSEIPGLGILNPMLEELWFYLRSFVPDELRGGVNLESDAQLVSTDKPRKKLVPVTRKRDNGLGGYLLWHDACEDADGGEASIETSFRTSETQKYRTRRVNAEVRSPYSHFYSEVVLGADFIDM